VHDRHLYGNLSRLNNELTNLQPDVAKKNAELGKLNDQKNRFLGMAAHHMRGPLAMIYSLSEFMEADAATLNGQQREFITATRETRRRKRCTNRSAASLDSQVQIAVASLAWLVEKSRSNCCRAPST
jgi:signal transduction histidine kinase